MNCKISRLQFSPFCFCVLQCTWGCLQTLLGAILFFWFKKYPHSRYGGAIVTHWHKTYSVSLGLFIFVSDFSYCSNPTNVLKRILTHEYGHCIQSLMLGPLYIIVIAVPSFFWATLPYFDAYRKKHRISYFSLFCEKWADNLGFKHTNNKA